jgi:outer membrane receptor for ferrienterochelin and colicins
VIFTDGYIGHPGRKSTTPQLDFIVSYHGISAHEWRVNVGAKKEKLKSNESKNFGPGIIDGTVTPIDGTLTNATGVPSQIYISDENRTIKYVSLQDVWEFAPDWSLTAGVRYDDYSDVGSTTNSRAALVWVPQANLVTKLLYGSSFRAPSFSELYAKNNPVGVGNVNLKPEEIDTLELAFLYEPITNLTTGLSLYKFEAENMIDYIQAGNIKVAQNNTNLTGQGFEIELDWIINDEMELLVNYANQSTKNDATDVEVAFNPKQQLYIDVRWKMLPKWTVSSQLNLVADRERAQGDTRSDVGDYALVDLTIRHKKNDWGFAASIKNLFDKDAFEPSNGDIPGDYPLHERALFVEASYEVN